MSLFAQNEFRMNIVVFKIKQTETPLVPEFYYPTYQQDMVIHPPHVPEVKAIRHADQPWWHDHVQSQNFTPPYATSHVRSLVE